MARAYDEHRSLRFGRRECERVVAAVLLSLIMHLTFYAGYLVGEKEGWWSELQPPDWLHLLKKKSDLEAHVGHDRAPTIFVDVSHADSDAPVQAPYYSDKNSRAANPDPANSNVPKMNGTQTEMLKTETVPRLAKANTPTEGAKQATPAEAPQPAPKPPEPAKLQPTLPPPSPTPLAPTPPSETPQTPGETEQRKPQKETQPSPTPEPKPTPERPRTLRQALAQRDQLPGQEMQQDGGVPRHAATTSLDVKSTAFGDYDRQLIEAVQQRWDDLLDNHRYAQDRDGKVVLRFKLKPDGTVIEMQTLENTVGEMLGYLCQESIEEAAPFARWPPDMSRMIGTNYRDITFTFYYY